MTDYSHTEASIARQQWRARIETLRWLVLRGTAWRIARQQWRARIETPHFPRYGRKK